MRPQGQLGQTQQPPMLIEMAAPLQARANVGLLGNDIVQSPVGIADSDDLLREYQKRLATAHPAFKLATLKRQQFTSDGRQARIAASLAALNAQQPTELTLAEWKEVVEEVEDEE